MIENFDNCNLNDNKDLSTTRIYDILKVKDAKKFHLGEAKKNIVKALESVRIAQIDLNSIQFAKNKKLNRSIIKELSQQLGNTSWFLLSLLEAVSAYQQIKQNASWLSNDELKKLLEKLRNPEEIL